VNVVLFLSTLLERFASKAGERKLSLHLDVAEGLPTVQADPQELAIALNHLVENALKFTPAGGEVTVGARKVGEAGQAGVEIAVRDTGIGIAADQHARIFDRFYQVDSSLTRQYGGVGIGLAVVKQSIEAHGSQVQVESEPDKGSTFRFVLPLAE
jgi:two-component system phosphate regulon sensor histidine kinase PhoR